MKIFYTTAQCKRDNTGIGTLQSPITNPADYSYPPLAHSKGDSPYPEIHITIQVVHKLSEINPSEALGHDSIPAQVLKTASEELAPMLTHQVYFNNLYSTSVQSDSCIHYAHL